MADENNSGGRPRRSTRVPTRFQAAQPTAPVPAAARTKRKTQDAVDTTVQLEVLLKSPKSELTTMDISDVLNAGAWGMLSEESRAFLCTLLPPTAFLDFQPSIESHHPSRKADDMDVDSSVSSSSHSLDLLDITVFTDPHFLAAAHTFQDHLFSGWMSDAHMEKVRKFQQGVRDGSLSAPYKDETWESENPVAISPVVAPAASGFVSTQPESSARAGQAAEVRLVDLVKHGVIKVGDVLAYKRNFSTLDVVIEKDVIVESIHPKTHAITVLVEPGTVQHLPMHLLTPDPSVHTLSTRSMDVTSPSMLETGVLDIDGRVDRARRPNGNAWKSITVWRWRGGTSGVGMGADPRGGRESYGTLFYLRGCYYHDR